MLLRIFPLLIALLLPLSHVSARTLAGGEWRPPGLTPIHTCLIFPPRGFLWSGEGDTSGILSGLRSFRSGGGSGIGGASLAGRGGSVSIPKTPCKPPPPGLFGINLLDLGPNIPNYCGEGLTYFSSSSSVGGGSSSAGGGYGGFSRVSRIDESNPYFFVAGQGTSYPLLPLCTSTQLLRHDQRGWQY